MKRLIQYLIQGQSLSYIQSYELFCQFSKLETEQKAAILALLSRKGESVEEVLGARQHLMEHAKTMTSCYPIVDLVGTGGDGAKTFNISTAASLVVASCGAYVAKHGGRSVTSQSGSSDVIEQLNLTYQNLPDEITQSLQKNRYAYLYAPNFHPMLNQFGLFRKKLGFPTIFNILGPLINPMQPKRQVIGVYRQDLLQTVATILKTIETEHALVVHAKDGLDEISINAETQIIEIKSNHVNQYTISPEDLGFKRTPLESVRGGSAAENARMIESIILGEVTGPTLDIVLLNSAAGLVVSGIAEHLEAGVEIAREAIALGKTAALLQQLRQEACYV